MNYKLIFVSLILLFFGFYLMQEMILGTDGYYFLNVMKNKEFPASDNTPILSQIFFLNFPLNFVLIKGFLAFLMALSGIILGFWATLYKEKNEPFFLSLIVFASPLWILTFVKFEDDTLAIPFLLLSNYFLLKGIIKNSWIDKGISFALIGFSCLIWKGSLIYFIAWGLTSLLTVFPTIYAFLKLNLLQVLSPIKGVYESTSFIGLGYISFLWLGVKGIRKEFLILTLFWFLLGIYSAKFMFHAIPFLALSCYLFLLKLDLDKQKLFSYIAIALSVGLCISFFFQPVTISQINAVKYAIQVQKETGLPISNQWDLGHLISFLGSKPKYAFSPPEKTDYSYSITITYEKLKCKKLNEFSDTFVYFCPKWLGKDE